MNIVLGYSLDGSSFHFTNGHNAEAGTAYAGSVKMISILETHLGLPTCQTSSIIRSIQYENAIRQSDSGMQFYSTTFGLDPRGTAKKLLSLRDEILLNSTPSFSWSSFTTGSDRVKAIAAIEANTNNLMPGTPDRLLRLFSELKLRRIPNPIASISLTEPLETWPSLWRSLLDELKVQGTIFSKYMVQHQNGAGDLAHAKNTLHGLNPKKRSGSGDATLVLIEANNPIEEADALALIAREIQKQNETVVIIADKETDQLQGGFRRISQPLPDGRIQSYGLDALQILPLRFYLAWKPVDPYLLQQYLALSVSPLPKGIRDSLLDLVCRTGTVGGQNWDDQITGYLNNIADKNHDQVKDLIDLWLDIAYVDPNAGLSVNKMDQICIAFLDWLQKRAFLNQSPDQGMILAIEQTKALREAFSVIGEESLSLQELHKLFGDIIESMPVTESAGAECGSPVSVSSPGAILTPADTVLWWNAGVQSLESLPERFWTQKETNELEMAGVQLLAATAILARQRSEWLRGIDNSFKRLILFYPRVHGDGRNPDEVHPVWHELIANFEKDSLNQLTIPATSLFGGGLKILLGTKKPPNFSLPTIAQFPDFRPVWNLNSALLTDRRRHSASSLMQIGGCCLSYVMKYLAKIESSDILTVSEDWLLHGNVAHDVIERFLDVCKTWPKPDKIKSTVHGLFTDYIQQEGAILNLPGMDKERLDLENKIVLACQKLVAMLAQGGYEKVGIEKEYSADTLLGHMIGQCDLVFQKKKAPHDRIVIDLKWAGRKSKYEQLSTGTAIQLAVYSELLGKPYPKTGFFIIFNNEILTVHDDIFPGATIVQGPDEHDTWKKIVTTINNERAGLFSGKAPIGVPDGSDEPTDFIYAPCTYCNFGLFCRKEVQV